MSSWKPHPALAQPAVLFLLVCLFVFSMRVQFKAVQCYISVPAPSLCYCPHQSFFTEPLSPPGAVPLSPYMYNVEGLGLSFIYCCHFGRTLIKAKRCFKACVGMGAFRGASLSPAVIKEDVGLWDSYRGLLWGRQAQHCPAVGQDGAKGLQGRIEHHCHIP